MIFILVYLVIGMVIAWHAYEMSKVEKINIPRHAFIITVLVWPYTIYLSMK